MIVMPHCDSSVLHEPNKCQFCDRYPEAQKYRISARINFTGQNDEDKTPCPSTHTRSAESVDAWGGNRAQRSDEAKSERPLLRGLRKIRW